MSLQDKKALSPVISGIILVAVVIAVAVTATSWMGSMTFGFMQTEELRITSCMWAPDASHANITIINTGSSPVPLSTIQVDGSTAADYSFVSGTSTVEAGETATIQITNSFVGNARHQFNVITNRGNKFVFMSKAPQNTAVTFKIEWGTITADDNFKIVSLQNSYANPVIVCTPQYTSGIPRTIRITEVSGCSFKVRVQNPSGTVCPETVVHYLVVEEGVWESPIKLEARTYETDTIGSKNEWNYDTRTYAQEYTGNILVFHQVITNNDPSWITTYVSKENSKSNPPSSSNEGFRIALNGAEASNSHQNEIIGYIILQEDYNQMGDTKYEAKQTTDSVRGYSNDPPYNTAFSQTFDNTPAVLVSTQLEMDGGDGGWIVTYSTNHTQAGLMVDEDQETDNDRSHANETCGFIAFETAGKYP